MSFSNHLLLHWRSYSMIERLLVLFPFTLVTPSFIPFISLGHDGEPTHEFVITVYLFVTLIIGISSRHKNLIAFPEIGSVQFYVCLFALWTGCSLLWTSSPGATLDQIVIWTDYAVLMLISATCLRRRSKIGLASVLMVTAGLMAAIKLMGYALVEGDQPENSPLFKNIGVETEILVTLVPIFWVVFLSARRKQVLVASVVGSIICVMAGVSSYQRTPLLALMGAIGIIITYVLARWFRPRFMSRALILILAIIFSYALQTNLPSKLYGRTGTEVLAQKIVDEEGLKSSAAGRFIFWDVALEMLIRHPLLGVGGGAYKAEYITYRTLVNQHSRLPAAITAATFTPDQSDGANSVFRAHNEFFQVLGELGLVGGLILLAMLLLLGQYLFKQRNSIVSIAVMSGVIAFLISSNFTSFSFRWIPCGLSFFLLVSLTSSNSHKISTQLENHKYGGYYFVVACLALCCFRASQVLLSQHFEAKADFNGKVGENIACEYYQSALFFDPYNFTAGDKLGTLFYRTKDNTRAVPLLESAMNQGINDVSMFQTIALAQSRQGNFTKAEITLKKGLAYIPSSVLLRVVYSDLLRSQGEVRSAETVLSEATKINSEYTNVVDAVWRSEKVNANAYSRVATRLGPLWGVVTVNRSVESSYQK